MKLRVACVAVALFSLVVSLAAQNSAGNIAAAQVPPVIQFSNVATDQDGNPLTGSVGITFSLYNNSHGGDALWSETQNVQLDNSGHYIVYLGITQTNGLPATLFTSGQAHWLGVKPQGQPEQARVFLVSVPYAMKAGDAATIGGLPPSAFVLAPPTNGSGGNGASVNSGTILTPAGTGRLVSPGAPFAGMANYIPVWTGPKNAGDSIMYQASGKSIGVGTTSPGATLDVNGNINASTAYNLGGTAFTFGSYAHQNAFLGFAGNATTTGSGNTASGYQALETNTSGGFNTALGTTSLAGNTTGTYNSAVGYFSGQALGGAVLGNNNTFIGAGAAGATVHNLTNATAIGSNAEVAESNALVLGAVTGVNSGTSVNVGIGTTTPSYTLDVSGTGIRSISGGNGVFGQSNGTASGSAGVYGIAANGSGSAATYGVYGSTSSQINNSAGVYGSGPTGVLGVATFPNTPGPAAGGVFIGYTPIESDPTATDGVDSTGGSGGTDGGNGVTAMGGSSYGGGNGVTAMGGPGNGADGIGGSFTGGNAPSSGGDGVDGIAGSGYAGNFTGDVNTTGMYLINGEAQLRIDHPLDPANKYLSHSSVESSEMMNIYSGNIVTDSQGHATVQLPEWFEVLNTDFRYQLTVIGQFAQAIVARKIENNRFEIRTNAPNVEVSWQVTGVRQDAYAKAHPLVVEQGKEARLRGFYTHPELYGAPPEKQIEWARHPQQMKKMQEMRARQLAAAQRLAAMQK
jgi:hypothetical protein